MSKIIRNIVFFSLFVMLTSMGIHKFYSSIYQINYVPQKKMIQITSRIFIDDLNNALEKRFHTKSFIGTSKETLQDEQAMKIYLAEKFSL